MDGPGRSRPMGGISHRRDVHGIRRQRRGVASVVGALLVLVIALIAFTLVFTEAVPAWMSQNETVLEQGVQASFAQLQATIDLQDAWGSPHTGFTSVALTSSAVPVLASPTQGTLLFEADSVPSFANVTVSAGAGGSGSYTTNSSLGQISVVLPNRYIPSATLRFEDGALFMESGGSASRLIYAPLFSVERSGRNTSLAFTIVQMTGPTTGTGAAGTQQIVDTIRSSSTAVSHGAPATNGGYTQVTLTLRLGSTNACAWATFFQGALDQAGVPSANYTVQSPSFCSSGSSGFGVVILTLNSMTFVTISWLELSVGIGGSGA